MNRNAFSRLRPRSAFLLAVALHGAACAVLLSSAPAVRADLPQTIERIKPAVVAVGTLEKTRRPPLNFLGTGFAVDDGYHIVTNAHVLPSVLDPGRREALVIVTGTGKGQEARGARVLAVDEEHDLALLRIGGTALPTLSIADSGKVREGQPVAFTGFPLGMALGFHAVTHRGTVSSVTPIVLPSGSARQLDAKAVNRIRKEPYDVLQLDATAYPGNSGSPLYDPETGAVYGIVNMVFVKGTKESALSHPSGITYAIPANYIRGLLERAGKN